MSESIMEERPVGTAAPPPGRSADVRALPAGDRSLSLDSVLSIPVTVRVILGTTTMQVSDLMNLSRGAIVPLDNRVGEPVDVVVNGRVVARGELVVMDDDNTRFGVSLTEIVGSGNGKAG